MFNSQNHFLATYWTILHGNLVNRVSQYLIGQKVGQVKFRTNPIICYKIWFSSASLPLHMINTEIEKLVPREIYRK